MCKTKTDAPDTSTQKHQNVVLWLCAAAALLQAVLLFYVCTKLPERVPVHFSFRMEVDRWGSPYELWALSMLAPVILSVQLILSRKKLLHKQNQKISERIALFTAAFIAALSWWIIGLSFKPLAEQTRIVTSYLPSIVYGTLGLFSVVLGNYEGTIRPNRVIGIKLPWTLEDNENWRKTHRFAAPLTVISGVLFIAGGIIVLFRRNVVWYAAPVVSYVVLTGIVPVVYSYLLSRKTETAW